MLVIYAGCRGLFVNLVDCFCALRNTRSRRVLLALLVIKFNLAGWRDLNRAIPPIVTLLPPRTLLTRNRFKIPLNRIKLLLLSFTPRALLLLTLSNLPQVFIFDAVFGGHGI